jgi:hypothetical protein
MLRVLLILSGTFITQVISTRIPLTQTAQTYEKYSEFIDNAANYETPRSIMTQVGEYFWGKDSETVRFESTLRDLERRQHRL